MRLFMKKNTNFFVFLGFFFVLEISSLYIITTNLFITSPWLLISILGILFCIYNLAQKKATKNFIIYFTFITQIIINFFCVTLYENSGTLFDFNMFNLVNETLTLIEDIQINYFYLIYIVILLIAFCIVTTLLNDYTPKKYKSKKNTIISSLFLILLLIGHTFSVIPMNKISIKNFTNKLYINSQDKYSRFGTTSNFVNEIYKMLFFDDYNSLSYTEIDNYIYKETNSNSNNFGISKGNNLITILAESFEWFPFINDVNTYPNGANLDNETLDALYPNLRRFYNMSIVMNNHYANNKTDISEHEAIIGSYPSNNYLSYSASNNNFATSLTSTLKMLDSSITTNFFHNNTGDFYNRNITNDNIGFDNSYFIEEMSTYNVFDYMKGLLSEDISFNLDSEMIEKMKDKMFLENERFYTHITTVSTHGAYVYRENMQRWHDKMSSLNVIIENNHLKNYMAATMELDYALGLIIEDLEKKNLLEKTTIVIFSDHNTYMNSLANRVKNINDYNSDNYTELYRLPLMIYDSNINHQIINKFTTTYDIVPTIFDLFGINYYTNLYYGNSIFSDEESILYSKAFDVFLTKDLYFSSIKNILYKSENVNNEYIKKIENKCLNLLNKIYYTNHIFYYDYFKNENNYLKYFNNMKLLNN